MAVAATYGDTAAFNVVVSTLGSGYQAALYDGTALVFTRRGYTADINTSVSGTVASFQDVFASYVYNAATATLTLSGAVNTNGAVTFTRTLSFRFVSAHVVEDVYTVEGSAAGGGLDFANWNYSSGFSAVWDLDDTNAGSETPSTTLPLGIGVQLAASGPVYGCVGDNPLTTQNGTAKQSSTTFNGGGVSCTGFPATGGSYAQPIGDVLILRQWFFKSQPTMKDFTLQAHLAVSAALGYTGSTFTQVLKSTAYLNTHARADNQTLHLVPSNYYPRMYSRDSFWHSFGIPDQVEQEAITLWETAIVAESGHIPTSINADGSYNAGNNDEGTLYHLIRAYYDSHVRGLTVNVAVAQQALTWVLSHIVSGNEYRNLSTSDTMWMDNFLFSGGYASYSQGLWCVAIQAAIALGLTGVTSADLTAAQGLYRAAFNGTYLQFANNEAYLAPDVFVGEALSIFLFDKQLLTAPIVADTLSQLTIRSATPAGLKIIANPDGSYLPVTDFEDQSQCPQGEYQNGGTWFLWEYLAWWVGIQYGVFGAYEGAAGRMAIDLAMEGTSHEYLNSLPGSSDYLTEITAHHTYSWNCGALALALPPRRPIL